MQLLQQLHCQSYHHTLLYLLRLEKRQMRNVNTQVKKCANKQTKRRYETKSIKINAQSKKKNL